MKILDQEKQSISLIDAKKIVSICGSGQRALGLIQQSTEKLIIMDSSLMQLSLAKLALKR